MKKFYSITVLPLLLLFSGQIYGQGTGQAFHPAIAEGSKYVYKTDQVLRWENPSEVLYNEVYISPYLTLVENLDPSSRIMNGYPNVVFSSAALDQIEPLQYDIKYYWRVVEYSNTDTAAGPVWYFKTLQDLSIFNLFEDDFDEYTAGLQLACQNPNDWTTWNNLPCDPVEDPLVTQDYFYSDSNSFHITYLNDLSKIVGPYTDPVYIISMMMFIPEGRSAYWNALPELNPPYWGFEVEWNTDGTGVVYTGGLISATFTFIHNNWFKTTIIVNLMDDQAEFRVGNSSILSWQWSMGIGYDQLAALDFYGFEPDCDYYVDDFSINSGYILSPPIPPRNIQAEGSNDTIPKVVVDWLPGNNWGMGTGYAVYRKDGLPTEPGDYLLLTDELGTSTFTYTDTSAIAPGTYTYRVVFLPIGPSSAEATAYVPEPVPVELISFTGSAVKGGILLEWSTSTETNNKGFEVQRSEVRNQRRVWKDIGFVEGNGTTTERHTYRFMDNDVSAGKYVYRLKQIDYDGSFEYSKEAEVDITGPQEFSLEQNYPNPFNPITNINYELSVKSLVRLKVYNTLGEEVAALVNEEKPAGNYSVRFDGSSLPSGVYIYRLTAGNYTAAKKLVLLK